MKTCTKCLKEKDESEFSPAKAYKDGLFSWCRECNNAYRKEWNAKNRDRLKRARVKYRDSGKRQEYLDKNKEHIAEDMRNVSLKIKYGITLGQYNGMYLDRDGKCDICKEGHEVLCIDHDHVTNKVRGLLCKHCNWLLGHAKDSKEILESAIKYLEKNE